MRLRLFALSATIVLALGACGETLFEPTAATVDGHKITIEQVDAAGDTFAATPRFKELAKDGSGDEIRRQFEQSYLSQQISHIVITGKAEELGVEASDDEVQQQIDSIKQNFGSDEEFEKALADQGIQLTQLPGLVRDQLLEQKLRDEVTKDVAVTPQELRDYYDEHIADFQQSRVSHILVKKKPLADRLARELQALPRKQVEDRFATLAKQHSTDPGSAVKGGDLGLGPSSKYVEPFAKAVDALDVGVVSDPVQTQFGYHVILVTKKMTQSFAQARASIEAQLVGPEADKVWADWLKDAYEEADIRVNSRYGELDIETRRVIDTPDEDVPGVEGSETPSPGESAASPGS